jgi:DNA-binding transcriptional regulator YiaG
MTDATVIALPPPTPEEVRALRAAVGLSQVAMAAAAYVSLNGYQKWEQGERPIPMATWELLKLRAGQLKVRPLGP